MAEAIEDAVGDSIDNSLLQNALQRAQFSFGQAAGEEDFETRREAVIRLTNAFHDAEFERIGQIAESETELRDLREDNELARGRALLRATTATNTFTEERIRSRATGWLKPLWKPLRTQRKPR